MRTLANGAVAALALLLSMGGLAIAAGGGQEGQEEPSTHEVPAGETVATPEAPQPAQDPCARRRSLRDSAIDDTRRVLAETLCRATLWFDGLFGADEHPEAARNAHGRAEVSVFNSDYEGTRLRGRLNARVDLPNLQERLNAFVGRDDPDDFVQDRREGAALRSQMRDFQRHESWLAGFGYSLPGDYRQRFDVRVGTRVSTAPKLFVQGRWRRNIEVGEASLWHLRQTVFWTNRDGFGTTSAVEYDRVLTPSLLFRLAAVGTVSERGEGLDWRTNALLFQSLPGPHAMALEGFVRGETGAEVPLREYGSRLIYRRTLRQREWLFGEAFVGYSWPRRFLEEERKGSLAIGVGLELLFGRD
ncbi:MAG: hypothetical protein HRF46_13705 [Acidobacteriota bacterium]